MTITKQLRGTRSAFHCQPQIIKWQNESGLEKAFLFLQSDIVNDKMVTCTLALRPLMDILGKHFTASKLDDTGMNLLDWVVEGPVLAAVDRYFQLLSQPGRVVRIANM